MNKPNILFIPVDDLRPQIGCYGHPQMKTPNMDNLAAKGTLFTQAYCQVPVCGASRASLLTGRRPALKRFIDYLACVDEDLPGALTMPQYFKENGYETISVGKVFHHLNDSAERSWSEPPWQPWSRTAGRWRNYMTEEAIAIAKKENHRGPAYECADVDDGVYIDGHTAEKAVAEIARLSKQDKPFFLAAGFLKPHLPFNAPKKYWDLYRDEDINLADNPFPPENAPSRAVHNWGELRSYFNIPKEGPLPDEIAFKLVHGYYACTSYVDAQIGRVLDALEENGLADNTIIVLWGDHGWQLGEHGMWCKHCNFKTSLNAPMIVHVPNQKAGIRTDAIVEFIDIFPTLCELAGLPIPEQLDGLSLVPTLEDPAARVKEAAFSRYHAGESVRTETYLYTEWYGPNGEPFPEDGKATERMLYDHSKDPDENVNISERPENAEIIERLSAMLKKNREEVMKRVDAGPGPY